MKNLKKGLGQTFKRLEKVLKKDLEKGLGMNLKKLGKRHDKTWKKTGKDLKMTWKKTWKKDLNCFGKNLKKKRFGKGLGKA